MDKISMITLLLARAYTDKKTSEVPAVIQYKGVTTTALSDGATTNPITINGSSYTAVNGDTVFYDGVAYTFDGTVWQETISLAQIITELEGLDEKIGDLSDLTTTDKDSVVDAINELVTAVGGKVDKVEGKGLSTNDYTDADAAIVAGVTTALAGKQDTLTFDSVPTDGSTNPVESNGVYDALATKANASDVTDALALKQDKTDNTLQTTDKTVAGAINELKSGFTNLDNEVNGDATVYPYADVITIEDAIPANVADCSVKIEPVQDLHGYDKPWVGGAGKNKLPLVLADIKTANSDGTWSDDTYTLNDVSYKVNTDNGGNVTSIKVLSGTASAVSILGFYAGTLTGNYLVNGCPADGGSGSYNLTVKKNDSTGAYIGESDGSDFALTLSEPTTIFCYIRIASGYTIPSGGLTFLPMIRLSAETDATFAPYTNICPISGISSAEVETEGKNLVYKVLNNANIETTGLIKSQENYNLAVAKIKNGKTYTIKTDDVSGFVGGFFLADPVVGSVSYDGQRIISNNKTFISSIDGYVVFRTSSSYTQAQIEVGEQSTDYTPYTGDNTATISLGGTVYGGTVDFNTGVLTVTHGFTAFEGDNAEGWTLSGNGIRVNTGINTSTIKKPQYNSDVANILSNQFDKKSSDATYSGTIGISVNTDGYISVCQTGETMVLADWLTYLANNPLQVCYELATPTTIQLTPQQIQLLKGQNTLTASTGQISVTANGVSGSIGSVQEQVNELAEDVADVQSGLAKLHYHKVAESAATGTRADKLASLYTTYNTLPNDVRKSAILVRSNADILHAVNNGGAFSSVYLDASSLVIIGVSLNPGSFVVNSNGTTTDGSSTENTEVYSLWIIE